MPTIAEQEFSSHGSITDTTSDEEELDEEENDDVEEEESPKGWKTICGGPRVGSGRWSMARVLDPRSTWVQEWNRVFLPVCATGLFIDPLFFYALSISANCMCLYVDGWFAVTLTALRSMTDALHVCNMWLQLKISKRRRLLVMNNGVSDDEKTGDDEINSDTSSAWRHVKAQKGFCFDIFVILPLPQTPIILNNMKFLGRLLLGTFELVPILKGHGLLHRVQKF